MQHLARNSVAMSEISISIQWAQYSLVSPGMRTRRVLRVRFAPASGNVNFVLQFPALVARGTVVALAFLWVKSSKWYLFALTKTVNTGDCSVSCKCKMIAVVKMFLSALCFGLSRNCVLFSLGTWPNN